MTKHLTIGIVVFGVGVGCQDRDATDTIAVEANELGVTRVEISHSNRDGDRVLTIRGLDASDHDLGQVTLRTGRVLYTPEPDLVPATWSVGTELVVAVGADASEAITPDRDAHETPLPSQHTLAAFVSLHAVAAAIETEARIHFAPATSELAYTAGPCDGSRFPSANGNPGECCQDGSTAWFKVPSGTSHDKLASRTYGAAACTTSGGSSQCFNGSCFYGPCSAHASAATGNTNAAVFHPTNSPTQCGRDDDGTGADAGAPENYTGQSLYGGITASCGYVSCCYDYSTGGNVGPSNSTCLMGSYATELYGYNGDLPEGGSISVGPMENEANERIDFFMNGNISDYSASGGWGTCIGCIDPNLISSYANYGSTITITYNPTGFTTTVTLY